MSRFATGLCAGLAIWVGSAAPGATAEPPKIIAYDPTIAVADFLKTASIEDINAATDVAEAEAFDSRVEFSWGVALTSNYISGGVTQSDDEPAFQAWGEIAAGIVYAGIWLSTVDLDDDGWEFDLSWGIQPSFGPLTITAGYTRYFYDRTGNCCGEWIVDAEIELSQRLSVFGEIAYDPQADAADATAGFTIGLADSVDLSAEYTDDLETHEADWNAGVGWEFADGLSLDLRYYDAEFADPRYVVTLTWEGGTAR